MLADQLLHIGQPPACFSGVTVITGFDNQLQLPLHPLHLTRRELRTVEREHAHLSRLVCTQRADDPLALMQRGGQRVVTFAPSGVGAW